MKLEVLGCSGGIGGADARTSSYLVDDDVLIDCGTGVGDLSFEDMRSIRHVFISHAHLDHITAIPLLVDSIGETGKQTITVYATAETLHILRAHIFNWLVWPDFTAIPNRNHPYLRLQRVNIGESIRLGNRIFTALPAHHTVPAVAWCVDSGDGQLIYSGDTAYCSELITAVNAQPALRHLIIETAFPNEMQSMAQASRHLCPNMLEAMLRDVTVSPAVHISHLKPGLGGRIMAQIDNFGTLLKPTRLSSGTVLVF